MKGLKNINSFEVVYITISIATFTYTTWAAATVFEGHQPEYVQLTGLEGHQLHTFFVTNFDYFTWLFAGALIAVAVDIGTLIAARELAKAWNWMVLASFFVGAAASFYTQLTYSLYHTGEFTYGAGVTEWWLGQLTPLIDARVIVLPAILPLFAIMYTLARVSAEQEQQQKQAAKTVKIEKEQLVQHQWTLGELAARRTTHRKKGVYCAYCKQRFRTRIQSKVYCSASCRVMGSRQRNKRRTVNA